MIRSVSSRVLCSVLDALYFTRCAQAREAALISLQKLFGGGEEDFPPPLRDGDGEEAQTKYRAQKKYSNDGKRARWSWRRTS